MPRWWAVWVNTHFLRQSPVVMVKSTCPPAFIVHVSAITASGRSFRAASDLATPSSKCVRTSATPFFAGELRCH